MSVEQLFLAPGDGEAVSARGTEVVFKVAGEGATNGPTVIEFIASPGFSTGDHVHSTIEEIFYVLDGEFTFRAGDWGDRVGPGSCVHVPAGTPHGFGNPSDAPATMLLIISPGNVHEHYFRELFAILSQPGQPDPAVIGALRERYDTKQVSPLGIK